jgi:hypothetical protein
VVKHLLEKLLPSVCQDNNEEGYIWRRNAQSAKKHSQHSTPKRNTAATPALKKQANQSRYYNVNWRASYFFN